MRLWKRLWVAMPRLRIALLVVGFIALVAFIAYIGVAYYTGVFPDPDWTGFGPPKVNADGQEIAHFKTLWDWLGLLLVPLVLAIGGYFLTRSENRYALQLQERREAEAREVEAERAQDAALQAYLDQMTQLLLHENLRTSQPDYEVRSVARAQTLTVLRVLSGVKKATVLQFLFEAGLIGSRTLEQPKVDAIVSLAGSNLNGANVSKLFLNGADLHEAQLNGANMQEATLTWIDLPWAQLNGANLQGAIVAEANLWVAQLNGANLQGANLRGTLLGLANLQRANMNRANLHGAILAQADLREADLREADLREADLREADLTDCKVTLEQLAQAASLEGAKLPFDMPSPPAPKAEVAARKAE